MVRIRLRRVGAKKQPSYRLVVTDKRSPRDGRFIEVIGSYNPRTEPETVTINEARALYWLNVGAQPSQAVQRLLDAEGTSARFERLKEGESIETLVAEAEAEAEEKEEAPPEAEAEAEAEAPEEEAAEAEPEEEKEAEAAATEAAGEEPPEETEAEAEADEASAEAPVEEDEENA